MLPPRSARRGRHAARLRVRCAALAVPLTAGVVLASVVQDGASPAPSDAPVRARAAPPALVRATDPADRSRAVRALLEARAAAVLARDRAAFLATVDPQALALRARQATSFDALAQVPLSTWDYVLDEAAEPPDAELDRRYGRGRWWAPRVALRYSLEGFDVRPVVADHHLTFVRRDGRWLLAADDDFALRGRATPRELWDRGPVVAVRAPGVLALGRPAQSALLREAAALAAQALPRVTAVWGPWRERVVLVVPADAAELSALLGDGGGDVARIAAVATAAVRGDTDDDPAGDRVLLNPDAFAGLGALARRVVLTHEVTHVAARPATGPATPSWLAEGLADVVAYSGVDVPLAVAAADLHREVRAGRAPRTLPSDEELGWGSARLSEAYQGSWLAVRLLQQRHGRPALLRLYREVGARRAVGADVALEQALRSQLGTTTAAFTADWRAALQRQLG